MSSKVTVDRKKLDRLIAETGGIAQAVVNDTLDETATFAKQRVHIITGQTKGSIEVDHEAGEVTADFGAVYEEARGGSHAFLSNAFAEALNRAEDKVTEQLRRVMGG